MIVGIDLDNTIVRYDAVFAAVAQDAGLIEPGCGSSKHEIRESLRARPGGEERWQWLQAQVYGPRLGEAVPFAGFAEFVERAAALRVPIYVVSHKSERAAAEPHGVNLRDAARDWLAARFSPDAFAGVFFEDTRQEKLERIAALRCTHFVDDLAEVFLEPSFPHDVGRWLFDPAGRQPPVSSAERFASWHELSDRLLRASRLWTAAQALAGDPVESMVRVTGGGNNDIYRVRTSREMLALKSYGVPDVRERLGHEFEALRFLCDCGVGAVPRPVGRDVRAGAALYEWIEGERVAVPQPGDVAQALDFAERLYRLRSDPRAGALPPAAEAGIVPAAVFGQVEGRVERLRACAPELAPFLDEFEAEYARRRRALAQRLDVQAELAPGLQTLSPSDFGFHNALRRGGNLVFLDFEYFGWDDPVKLVADFVLHPGMALAPADRKEWLAGAERVFGREGGFRARLADLAPLYALKWCLILLNEFRPEVWERRTASRPELEPAAAKAAQLAKAGALLARVCRDELFSGG